MKNKELISILMESPYYFELPLRERLHLLRYHLWLTSDKNIRKNSLDGGHFSNIFPQLVDGVKSAKIILGYFPRPKPIDPQGPINGVLLANDRW